MINKWIFIIIIFVSSILVFIWFKDGYILGYAEGALPFYEISRYFDQTAYAWTEHPGLGSFASITTAGKPTYWVLTLIQQSGVPGFIIQAGVFWFFLVSSATGIGLLTRYFFKEIPQKYILLGIFFYWFNPIFLVNIWNRFLLNYIFFFALMPVACFAFLKGLRERKMIYVLILNIILVIYSYTFSSYSFLILLWLILSLFFLLYFLLEKDKSSRFFYIKFFFLTLVFFVLSNAWWISQMLTFTFSGTFKNISGTLFNTNTNYSILDALSHKLGNLTDVLRLINISFYTPTASFWASIYNSPFLILFHFLLVGTILYACFSRITQKSVFILTSLLFLSIYLSKGINPPLGEVYGFLFQHVKFMQAFRNPFEKFSLMIPLFITPLFCFSIYYYSKKFPRLKKVVEFFSVAILIFWSFPYFSGLIFTNTTLPKEAHAQDFKVKVPEYYRQSSNWLQSQGGNSRFLELPLADEGITYLWEKGYRGADMPSTLFATPGIIFNTSVPYYSKLVPEIDKSFFEAEDFSKIANLVNIRFYLIRDDIDWQERSLKNPQDVLNRLLWMQEKGQVLKVVDFGKISIWKNLNYIDSTFYIATNIVNVASSQEALDIGFADVKNAQVVVDGNPEWLRMGTLAKTDSRHKLYTFKKNLEQTFQVTYKKIDPTRYAVHIDNSTEPFELIFSELFDPNWTAKYSDGTGAKDHRLVNTYANGWWIEKTGSFDIEIVFTPQLLLNIGETISIITISVMIILSAVLYIKKWKA